MSTINHERPLHLDPAFPHILDDDAPYATATTEPVQPSLPGDDYLGAQARGVTATEAHDGESLDWKLERELPDFVGMEDDTSSPTEEQPDEHDQDYDPDRDGDQTYEANTLLYSDREGPHTGRLIEPDEGSHPDREAEAVAAAFYSEEYDLSPEEAAMHVEFER
jgi:hypothetical protein